MDQPTIEWVELTEIVAAVEDLYDSHSGRHGPVEMSVFGSVIPLTDHSDHGKEAHA